MQFPYEYNRTIMNPELENLVKIALTDGVLTDKEKEIIIQKVQQLGIDMDEFEMELQGFLSQFSITSPELPAENATHSLFDKQHLQDFAKNIITFWAHQRIKNEIKVYEDVAKELKDTDDIMALKRGQLNYSLSRLVETKRNAVISLKQIENITKNIKGKQRELFQYQIQNESAEKIDIDYINATITIADTALTAAKGTASGISTAFGAWALVGNLGTASTGTAIHALSGAAAYNATLAWLGGGSLAAGGGGMALGTVVLGGIVVIPALAVTGLFNHLSANKKIHNIKEKEVEALKMIDLMKKNTLAFELFEKRSDELSLAIEKSVDVFNFKYSCVYKKIYPVAFFSKFFKRLKERFYMIFFGQENRYFSDKDFKNISIIGNIAQNLAKLIDTKILNESEV